MADAITERRVSLGMDVRALVEATGLTRQGLAPLLRGERRAYQERLTIAVCRALKWSPDSIARLLRGESAEPLNSPGDVGAAPGLAARVDRLEAQLLEALTGAAGRTDEVAQFARDLAKWAARTAKAEKAVAQLQQQVKLLSPPTEPQLDQVSDG